MRAVVLTDFGGVENLQLRELPIPTPGPGEALIRIAATSLNPADVKTRMGLGAARITRFPLPAVTGWDLSGTVERCGEGVVAWRPGDEVFGSIAFPEPGRTHAEYATAPAGELARKPANASHAECAAASMAGLTAWQALNAFGRPGPGDRVLVHGASGGVGHMAVQIARALGAEVTGTSSAANRDFVLSLGAVRHIDYRTTPWEAYPRDFDFVVDTVGGEATAASFALLRKGGALVTLLPPPGTDMADPSTAERTELAQAAAARGLKFHFALMRPDGPGMAAVADLIARGGLRPRIAQRLGLSGIAEAHALLEAGRTVGKIVLEP